LRRGQGRRRWLPRRRILKGIFGPLQLPSRHREGVGASLGFGRPRKCRYAPLWRAHSCVQHRHSCRCPQRRDESRRSRLRVPCHLVLTLPFDVTHFTVVMFYRARRRLESRRGKHECSRHVVAHALLRAVSALLPRPLESNICASALKLSDIGLRVRATGRLHHLWWARGPWSLPSGVRFGVTKDKGSPDPR
jgi:hypothetical protein